MLPKQPNQSVIQAIRCLMEVVTRARPTGVNEVAEQLDMEPSRVHRFLRTLSHTGFLQQNARRKYAPGPAVYCLAASSLYASHFFNISLPLMEELRDAAGRIVALGVLWNRSVSYLYHASPRHRAVGSFGSWDAINSGIGMALLAQRTNEEVEQLYHGHPVSSGIADLLAQLQTIRETGHAFIRIGTGGQTLALPFPGNPYLGIGMSGKISKREIPACLEMLQGTIAKITERETKQEYFDTNADFLNNVLTV